MLSILCHFHGLLFARATLGFYSYIDQRNGPYSEGMFVVIVVDECFGDFASTEPMKGPAPNAWQLSVELNAGVKFSHGDGWTCCYALLHSLGLGAALSQWRAHIVTAFLTLIFPVN